MADRTTAPATGAPTIRSSCSNNYGPLDYDHTHILNLVYNWNLPSPIHSNSFATHFAGGAVNGWQLSGYTAFQSGGPIQGKLGTSLNAQYPSGLTVPTIQHPDLPDNSYVLPNGLRAVNVSPSVWFGTDAVKALIPRITCNPTAHLRQGQRFNPNCFAPPDFGTQGANVLPYIRNPNYWDSDLGIYKNFHITESRYIQIRASATNWLNHPIRQFGLANSLDGQLSFVQPRTPPAPAASTRRAIRFRSRRCRRPTRTRRPPARRPSRQARGLSRWRQSSTSSRLCHTILTGRLTSAPLSFSDP